MQMLHTFTPLWDNSSILFWNLSTLQFELLKSNHLWAMYNDDMFGDTLKLPPVVFQITIIEISN